MISKAITPLAARVAALEQERMKGVDSVRWAGTYKNGDSYRGGELVTHAGALWAAKCATAQTPGRPPEGETADYVLIVKNGGMR